MAFQFGSLKDNFFDSDKVLKSLAKGRLKALSKQGSFVRTAARSSIRYRQDRSAPGSPPSAHRSQGFTRKKVNKKTGAVTQQPTSPLRELIFFAYDPVRDTVVVGPELFRNSKIGGGIVPRALEQGGDSTAISRKGPRTIHVRARPFMRPAEEQERPKFASQFKDIMR